MSVPNALEEPLERLNYYNAQRLEAIDFRLEQLYHIRVRRWLNKSLYSPGIAAGLEVQKNPNDLHSVIVSPGLALDIDGREIIVLEEQIVKVCGSPRRPDGVQLGNYLVISYGEEKVAPMQDGCRVTVAKTGANAACSCRGSAGKKKGGCGCGGGNGDCSCSGSSVCTCSNGGAARDLSWGAPSRIRSEPVLLFQDPWPSDSHRKILLAQVVLNDQCQVEDIKSGMRRYATATKPPNTTPISIEGEKDMDKDNPKILRFHIENGFPDSATLYLQGALFSTLFYTELGRHTHGLNGSLQSVSNDFTHAHNVDPSETDDSGKHSHQLMLDDANPNDGVDRNVRNECGWTWNIISEEGTHKHPITKLKLQNSLAVWSHTHAFSGSVDNTGALNLNARTGVNALAYLNDLHVAFDGADVTPQILAQLQALNALAWAKLGDGADQHEFVKNGTGAIDLRQLGVDLSPGAHTLTFTVGAGGGKLLYNLYVS